MTQKNLVSSKTDEKRHKWKEMREYDYSRKTGKVILRGKYYSHDTVIECKNVKYAYHATHYAEIENE